MSAAVKKSVRITGAVLFAIYVAALIYYLFFAEDYGRGAAGMTVSYNLCPFREIRRYLTCWKIVGLRVAFLNLFGNVIGFVPFGLLFPVLTREARSAWRVTLLCFEISALIETGQLIFRVGCFDVDDILLNTLGGFLGYLLFYLSLKMVKRKIDRRYRAKEE